MNIENSKTESHIFRVNLSDKRDFKNLNKNIALANLSIYCTWKNIKSTYNDNKIKISAPSWNNEFDLSYGSHSVSDIQDYFEYNIKKNETMANNLPRQIYINKIKNRIVFKIKLTID